MLKVLQQQATRCWVDLPATPTADPGWLLVEEGFSLSREHEIESVFAVSNGYVGTRGALAEGSRLSSPATFIAGIFTVDPKTGPIPKLAVAPDWVRLQVTVNGHRLHLEEGEVLEHRRMLDMRQGILWREWCHRDSAGRVTRLRFLRLASLADRHVLLQSTTLMPENYSGRVTLESVIEKPPNGGDFSVVASTPHSLSHSKRQRETRFLPATVTLEFRAPGTGVTIAMALASQVQTEDDRHIEQELESGEGRAVQRATWQAEIGKTYRFDRLACLYTSRDTSHPVDIAAGNLKHLEREGIESVVEKHIHAWESRWHTAEVSVEGDSEAQVALRFACYHLISAANPEDERLSIGARALTGEAYKGHVFWDTEIYMLPFFAFTDPPSARALLMYRYHSLPAARKKATAQGYRGALYAWESTDTGDETAPPFVLTPHGELIPILSGTLEHHISADVAYAVWQYWRATGDEGFFVDAGAEILLETARFWASRGRIEDDGRYHIRKVVGPDEYHHEVDDNAYTNGMAQWNLERGAEASRILQSRWPEHWRKIADSLNITPEEAVEWQRLAERIYTGFDPVTGLLEQFQGYFGLDEIDLAEYEQRAVPMDILLGRGRIAGSKVIKQADVVMLIYLLWDRFAPEVREANFRYYEPRTGHGSSLSPSVHALVAARLGDIPLAQKYFRQAAEVDLANNMGNAAGGVHVAALGGLWQASIFGLAGMQPREEGLTFDPHLLPEWRRILFSVKWRGQTLRVCMDHEFPHMRLKLEEGPYRTRRRRRS